MCFSNFMYLLTRVVCSNFGAHDLHYLGTACEHADTQRRSLFALEVTLVCGRELTTVYFVDGGDLVAILSSSTHHEVLVVIDIRGHVSFGVLAECSRDALRCCLFCMYSPQTFGGL